MNHLEIFHIGTFAWVLGCWIGFGIGFLLRRSGVAHAAAERRGATCAHDDFPETHGT